jgi:hypothetical protein
MSYSVSVTRSGGGAVTVDRTAGPVKVVTTRDVGALTSAAQASQGAAETAAAAAAASAAAALVSAGAAASSASDAQTAQAAAELAETHAETAETNAETAQGLAETAQAAAEAAQAAAEAAQTGAETAETNAETAETNAEAAQAAAEAAQAAAEAAAASITLPLPVPSGGTGATDAAGARANLELGTMAVEDAGDYTPTSGLAAVATSGAYGDLTGTPTLGTMASQDASSVSISGGSIAGATVNTPNTGLSVRDPDGSHSLAIVAGSNLSADRTFTILTGNASRNLTMSGNADISGTNTGDQTITLTGDVTGSGTGSFAATIGAGTVTLAKMANIATDRLIGRDTTGTGVPEALTVGGGIEFTGAGGIQRSALTGDVTASAGSGSTTVISASATQAGKVELATDAEAITGTDTARATTPANVAAVWAGKLATGNTWTAAQTISITAAGTALTLVSSDGGATTGPDLVLDRGSGSPAANDLLSRIYWNGRNASGSVITYSAFGCQIVDATAGSEDAQYQIQTIIAGAFATRIRVGAGIFSNTATGGDMGNGTANFTAVYDDSVLLTCYVLEAERSNGKIDLDAWDERAPNQVTPAEFAKVITKPEVREEVRDAKGRLQLQPDGTFSKVVSRAEIEIVEVEPARVVERRHEPARAFSEALKKTGLLDPAVYTAAWRATGVLPLMPSPEEWETNGRLSAGALAQRLWELCEIQAVHIGRLSDQIVALSARVEELEA